MELVPEVVEWDCQKVWKKGTLPDYIQVDLKKCNRVWLATPRVPKTPRMALEWEWEWHPWVWKEGPSIPSRARFDLSVEIHLDDHDIEQLRQKSYDEMHEKMLSIVRDVSFAVYLCIFEKYRQGLVVEEPGCMGYLTKSVALLGRFEEDRVP